MERYPTGRREDKEFERVRKSLRIGQGSFDSKEEVGVEAERRVEGWQME
jgi:hypothetical protein